MENSMHKPELDINPIPTDEIQDPAVSVNLSNIEILRDRLEKQKANKLKAEQLVSTLSKIKARERASRRSAKHGEKKIETGIPNQTTKRSGINSSSALKEKSDLLKKKLEEDRAKLESKMGQADLGKVSEIVEHLRAKLEDQDRTIQQMNNSFGDSTTALEEVSRSSQPDIPPEVKQRINELEMKILDLQENLKEKDSVITARTQAITLLSEDMARKGKNTLDTLEETQRQMKMMQANFVTLEVRMNEEKTRLKEELEVKKSKIQQIERNYRTAESARFELSTKVAELQEKVVSFQTKNISLEEKIAESEATIKDLQDTLDNNNKQTIKMKAHFKSKLKALEDERDLLKKEEKINEELKQLREQIVALEAVKATGILLEERIHDMEDKVQRQEFELDSHVKAITFLETENLNLHEECKQRNTLIKEKEVLLESLSTQLKDLDSTKSSLEIKCCQLEQKLDEYINVEKENNFKNCELEEAKQTLADYKGTINELKVKLDSKESEIVAIIKQAVNLEGASALKNIQEIASSLLEWQARYSALSDNICETTAYCKELEDKARDLEAENHKLSAESVELNGEVNKLNSLCNSKNGEVALLRQNLSEKELEICRLNDYNKSLEGEINNLREALQSTTLEMHRLSQQLEELNTTQQKVEQLNEVISIKESELEQRSRKLSEYKKFHKLKSEDVIRISHELENVTVSSQQRIYELETALSESQQIEQDLKKEIEQLKEVLSKPQESDDIRFQEQSIKIKKLVVNLKLKTKLVKDLEGTISELERTLQDKNVTVANLECDKIYSSQNQIEHTSNSIQQIEENRNTLEADAKLLRECLKAREDEIEQLKYSSNDIHNTVVKIKEVENENEKLKSLSETKSEQLIKMEEDMTNLNGLHNSLLTELEQIQESRRQDILCNESVLDSFKQECLDNQKVILELNNQLEEAAKRYEQTCAKLEEKEYYIQDLEQKLEKVKLRLLQIESTVDERKIFLVEKAKMLDAVLVSSNQNERKHEDEIEYKISEVFDIAEVMWDILKKNREENFEIKKSLEVSLEECSWYSKELENERMKIQVMTKNASEMHASLTNYDKTVEDNLDLQTRLREAQSTYEHRIKYLENQLTESEECQEAENHRLQEKIIQLETERQDTFDKCNTLLLEKQQIEEDFISVQQTIANVTNVEIEQLKISHHQLSEELHKELEKRQEHIFRIQELENELVNQKKDSDNLTSQYKDEILSLHHDLDKEIQEKEKLHYEMLKENAEREVDYVLSKAEETYFNIITKKHEDVISTPEIDCHESNGKLCLASSSSANSDETFIEHGDINSYMVQHLNLDSENKNLKIRIEELENQIKKMQQSNVSPDCEDWTAVIKDDDDGWGWGCKEAMLEHEHKQKQLFNSNLEATVLDLQQKTCISKEENTRLSEELKMAHIKCNKLLKKLKELKFKNESLEKNSHEKNVGLDDLDVAMQEEWKFEVERLDKNLKQCITNLNNLQSERDGFLKRINTLTSGNEMLVEIKERQDIEIEMWQRRSNELQNKVQGLEWTITELNAERNESAEIRGNKVFEEKEQLLKNALEMEEKLNVIAAENDFLQSLIVGLKDNTKNTDLTAIELKQKMPEKSENNYLLLMEENSKLKSEMKTLYQKLMTIEKLEQTSDEFRKFVKENERLPLCENIMQEGCLLPQDDKSNDYNTTVTNYETEQVSGNQFSHTDSAAPVFFRGFGASSDIEGGFEVSTSISGSHDEQASSSNKSPSVDLLNEAPLKSDKIENVYLDNNSELIDLSTNVTEEKSDSSLLGLNTAENDEESKQYQIELGEWNSWSVLPSSDLPQLEIDQEWGDKINCLNKKIDDKDIIIDDLKQQLNFKSQNRFNDSNKTVDDLFSQEENNQESQVNHFVSQITQLTKTLHEKELEIEQLNENKEKYKEMYKALLVNESPDQSNSNKEQLSSQNILFNQFLEDKETELEMMSQRIEQTIVAKENLQDELTLKLNEMEAVNLIYETPKSQKEIMLLTAQPENIEEVRTLCNEVAELTKLLQEKESELELAKLQIDEAYLEKENLIDDWTKTIEEYKQKYKSVTAKNDLLANELEALRDSKVGGDFESQCFDELSQKNQQLMNCVNVLRDENDKYRDMETQLYLLESNLKDSQSNNETLHAEIRNLQEFQNAIQELTQDIELSSLNLLEKVRWLKTSFMDTKVKLIDIGIEVDQKEQEIESLKQQLKVLEVSIDQDQKVIVERTFSPTPIKTITEPFRSSTELSSSEDDSRSRHTESSQGQTFLMNEIQSLKQVLAMKDAEITRMSIALNDAQENLIRRELRNEEASLRQRLDEALYTLHLRDVRCNELELELMQLLEERDSLQLRLSTAIRLTEGFKERSTILDENHLKVQDKDTHSSVPDGDSKQLQQKLDQLHNVGYRKDPALQQDQHNRHQEQMHLYTHNDTQDESHSSSGFFNWIFGSSGPQDIV